MIHINQLEKRRFRVGKASTIFMMRTRFGNRRLMDHTLRVRTEDHGESRLIVIKRERLAT